MNRITELEALIEQGLDMRGNRVWVDDRSELNDAVLSADIGLLTAFCKVSSHRDVRLRNARRVYEMLVHEGYTDAGEMLSPEVVIDFLRIDDVVGWVEANRPMWDDLSVYYPLICLFIAAEGQDREMAEEIIIGRRIVDVVQVRELLAEMRSNAGALVGGTL